MFPHFPSHAVGRGFRQVVALVICEVVVLPGLIAALAPPANAAGTTQPLARRVNALGRLVSYREFPTNLVEPREVDVWLPPGYDEAKTISYPVVYMQDGQNLFDPDLSMWHKTWGIDKAMVALISAGKTPPAIIVGIWNTPSRTGEYMPQKAAAAAGVVDSAKISNMPGTSTGAIVSDSYLKFIVEDVKPFIDTHYRTRPGRATTFIMGSSMGGLISIYAISEYPDIFGGAACLSTHWPAANGATVAYLKGHLPDPENHRIYFDFGTETLDANYEPYQNRVDAIMLSGLPAGDQLGDPEISRRGTLGDFMGCEGRYSPAISTRGRLQQLTSQRCPDQPTETHRDSRQPPSVGAALETAESKSTVAVTRSAKPGRHFPQEKAYIANPRHMTTSVLL